MIKPTDITSPFTEEISRHKIKPVQDAWNTFNPELVAQAYTIDLKCRNRIEFFNWRDAIVDFLKRKWAKELDYRLMKDLWYYAEIVYL